MQRIILGVSIPLFLYFITYPIAYHFSEYESLHFRSDDINEKNHHAGAYAFMYTWPVWSIYILITGFIEFILWSKKIINRYSV